MWSGLRSRTSWMLAIALGLRVPPRRSGHVDLPEVQQPETGDARHSAAAAACERNVFGPASRTAAISRWWKVRSAPTANQRTWTQVRPSPSGRSATPSGRDMSASCS